MTQAVFRPLPAIMRATRRPRPRPAARGAGSTACPRPPGGRPHTSQTGRHRIFAPGAAQVALRKSPNGTCATFAGRQSSVMASLLRSACRSGRGRFRRLARAVLEARNAHLSIPPKWRSHVSEFQMPGQVRRRKWQGGPAFPPIPLTLRSVKVGLLGGLRHRENGNEGATLHALLEVAPCLRPRRRSCGRCPCRRPHPGTRWCRAGAR